MTRRYDQVLAWKGAVFARQRRLRMARDQKELAPLFEQLQTVTGRLATLTCALPAPEQRAAWRAQSAALSQRKEELESELATQCAAFQQQRIVSRLTSGELGAALPPEMALVDLLEYSRSRLTAEGEGTSAPRRHVAAFVVRREQPIVRIELGPAAPIEKADGQLAERLTEEPSDAIPQRRIPPRFWAAFVLSGDWR